jgi:hypothetical protein
VSAERLRGYKVKAIRQTLRRMSSRTKAGKGDDSEVPWILSSDVIIVMFGVLFTVLLIAFLGYLASDVRIIIDILFIPVYVLIVLLIYYVVMSLVQPLSHRLGCHCRS